MTDLSPKAADLVLGLEELITELEHIKELAENDSHPEILIDELGCQTGTIETLVKALEDKSPKMWRGMPLATIIQGHNGLGYALEIPLDDQGNPRASVIRVVEYYNNKPDAGLRINDVQEFNAVLPLPFLRELSHCFDNFVSAWEKK